MTEKEVVESLEIYIHKLRNPLHAAGINLDVLKSKLKKKIPYEKDVFKHLEIVNSEVERLNTISEKFIKYLNLSDKKKQQIELVKLLDLS